MVSCQNYTLAGGKGGDIAEVIMRMILFRERQRMEIVPLENGHIEAAAEMFVDKLCGLRKSAPALPETMLDPRRAAALLEKRARAGAGLAAVEDGRLLGT